MSEHRHNKGRRTTKKSATRSVAVLEPQEIKELDEAVSFIEHIWDDSETGGNPYLGEDLVTFYLGESRKWEELEASGEEAMVVDVPTISEIVEHHSDSSVAIVALHNLIKYHYDQTRDELIDPPFEEWQGETISWQGEEINVVEKLKSQLPLFGRLNYKLIHYRIKKGFVFQHKS